MVAIDTHNSVWVSKDEGRHWMAIRAQWPGRAVKASLVEFTTAGLNISGANVIFGAGAAKPFAAGSSENAIDIKSLKGKSIDAVQGPSITGTVTDQTGALIPGASVTVIDTRTGERRDTATDTAGHYLLAGLAPGTYQVEVRAKGFSMWTDASVAVAASGQSVENAALKVSSDVNSVTVISGADAEVPVTNIPAVGGPVAQVPTTNLKVSKNKKIKPAAAAPSQAPALFEITTDTGDRWTSADGVTWTPH
jgi:hypothetical protein